MEYTAPVKLDRRYWKIYVEIALLSLLCVTQYFGISIANLALTCGVLGIHFLAALLTIPQLENQQNQIYGTVRAAGNPHYLRRSQGNPHLVCPDFRTGSDLWRRFL